VEVDDVAAPRADRSALDFATAYGHLATQVQASQGLLAQLQGQAIEQTLRDRAALTEVQTHLTALQAAASPIFAQVDKLPRLAAIDIEIRKQLRLILIDSQFLNTARQPATLTARLESIHGHLELLDRYGQGALLLLNRSDPPSPDSPDYA
jgi:hypothetical protein